MTRLNMRNDQGVNQSFQVFSSIAYKPFFFLLHSTCTSLSKKTDFGSDKMAFSSNDLYPIVVVLKDLDDDAVDGNRSSNSIVDSYREKATTAAASILSSTIFCGYDDTSDTHKNDYTLSKKQVKETMNAAASDRYGTELLGDHRRQDHHGASYTATIASRNSSFHFNQSSTGTTKQIVFAEATTDPKYRQLDNDYVLTQQIVRCNVATLWECIHRTSGSRYCVKAIDKRRFKTKADKDTALREMSMYRWLFSNSKSISCIPQLHDMLEDQTHYYIVQEYEAGGGNLGSMLRDHGPLSEAQMRLLTRSLLEAVSKLHAQSICHNDLHLENVLIRGIGSINEVLAATAGNCRNMIKLCDLGRALCVSHQPASEDSVHHIRHSSLYYVAPEVLSGKSPGLASDMWSIGVILYVCFCGHLPFHCDPQLDSTAQRTQLKKQICLAEYSFPNSNRYWAKVSRSVKQFISSLLHPDPVVRMTCHEALSHPWIAPAIGEVAKTPRKSSIRRKAGNESPNHLNVELAQACEIHPLKVENPPAELTSHSKKSLVYRLWGKMKQKKHRATKSETDISTTASSALSSHSAGAATVDASPNVASNSTNGHHDRRHQSL